MLGLGLDIEIHEKNYTNPNNLEFMDGSNFQFMDNTNFETLG